MKFELHGMLDKIQLDLNNEEVIIKKIRNELTNIVDQKFKIYDIHKEKKPSGPNIAMENFYYCLEDGGSVLGLSLTIQADLDKETFETIYNTWCYLMNYASSQEGFSISVDYNVYFKIEDSKFRTCVNEEHTRWDYVNYGKIDIHDLLKYIAIDRPSSEFVKEAYLEFESELQKKEKYKEILQNVEKYDKKNIPFKLKNVVKYNDIEISEFYGDIKKFIKQAKEYKELELDVVKSEKVPYGYINTNFSDTTLIKHTIIDQDKNLFYALEEWYANADELDAMLYIYKEEIKKEDLQHMVVELERKMYDELYNKEEEEGESI